MNYRENGYNNMPPADSAKAMGEAIKILLMQSAGYLQGLEWAQKALEEEDIEGVRRALNNALSEFNGGGLHGNLENPGFLIECCIPRKGTEESHSYG